MLKNRIILLWLALMILLLAGCAAPSIKPTDSSITLKENEGIVVGSMVINRTLIKTDGTSKPVSEFVLFLREGMIFSPRDNKNGPASLGLASYIQFDNNKELQVYRALADRYFVRSYSMQGFQGTLEFSTVKANFSVIPGKITYIGAFHLNIVTTETKGSLIDETIATLSVTNDIENVRAEIEKKYPALSGDLVANLAEVTKKQAPVYPAGLYFMLKEKESLSSDN